MDFNQFLNWLLNSGGAAIVVSWLLERFPWFQALAANIKQYVYFGAVALLSVATYAVLNFVPANVIAMIAPYFQVLYGIFVAVFLGTQFHATTK